MKTCLISYGFFILPQVLVLDSSCVNIKSMKCLYVWHSKLEALFKENEDCIKITLFHRLPVPILISGGDSQFEVSCLPNDERVSYAGPAINNQVSYILEMVIWLFEPNPIVGVKMVVNKCMNECNICEEY